MSAKQPGSGALVGHWMGGNEVLALLAVGGTAEIYLARMGGEAGFEKYVVVKVLLDHLADDPDYVDMFLDEARLAAQLDHSNIVQTLELGQQDGRYYMVMEYLAGMSLAQLARLSQEKLPGGYMPIPVILGLAAQTCAGLHYAHHRVAADGTPLMVVHRDISPQNLVVSYEGVLKLVDFGIAKAALRSTHTQSGTIKGKFAYMSPEQCLAKPIDKRTDIFALGVICHELLTCRRLFKRGTTYETYQAIVAGEVPTPSSIRPELGTEIDELVLKALAYKKEERYESASEFGEAILQLLHRRGQSVTASDVAHYYEEYFAVELSEHAGRMRALIEHRAEETPVEDGWDSVDGLEVAQLDAVPAPRNLSAETAPIPMRAPDKPAPRADTHDHPAFDEDGEDDLSDATRVDDAAIEKVMAMHKRTAAIGAVDVPPDKQKTAGPDAATIMPSAGIQAKDVLAGLAAEKRAPAPAQIPSAKTSIETSGETVDDTLPPIMRDGAPPRPAGKKQNEVKRTMLGMRPVDKPGLAKPRPKPLPSLLDKNRPKGLARPPAGSSPAAPTARASTDAERATTNSELADRPTQLNLDTPSKADTRRPNTDPPSMGDPPRRQAAPTARTLYDSRPQTDRTAALKGDGTVQPSGAAGQPPMRADPTGPQPPFRPDSTGPQPGFQPDSTGPQPRFQPDPTGQQPPLRGRPTSQPPVGSYPHSTPSSSGMPMPPPGLARRRSPYPTDHVSTKSPPPHWMVAVVFVVAAGIGLGVTLLIAALAG